MQTDMSSKSSAIHVSRIKNQHQPITLPQWNSIPANSLDNSDSMSVISFSQRSTNNLVFDTEFSSSTNRLSVPAASTRSRKSNSGESTFGN